MAGKRRKYNIWIAYSDLFTNLSTFLFISAFGMFAAMGSGLISTPGWGGTQGCAARPSTQAMLTGRGAAYRSTPDAAPGPEDCTEYYDLTGYFFTDRGSFRKVGEERMKPEDWQDGICLPIYRTILQRGFDESQGRITLLASRTVDPFDESPSSCGSAPYRDVPQWFPPDVHPVETMRRCRNAHGNKSYNVCARVDRCLRTPADGRNMWCRQVFNALERYSQWALHCEQRAAAEQARILYRQCEDVAEQYDFPDDQLRGPGFIADVEHGAVRRLQWQHVDYAGVARRSDSGSGLHPDGMPVRDSGTVMLRVDYPRRRGAARRDGAVARPTP